LWGAGHALKDYDDDLATWPVAIRFIGFDRSILVKATISRDNNISVFAMLIL